MSQRGSSVEGASRRGGQRNHIPYRGDDLERGKKTGKAVQHVARDSDEFEPFEQILSQADKITPKGKPRRKSSGRQRLPPVQEDDLSMDMEVDENETDPETPSTHRRALRGISAPASNPRGGSRHNVPSRQPDVDFDTIPSPSTRSRSTTARRDELHSNNTRLSSRIGLEPSSAASSHRIHMDSNVDNDIFEDSVQMSFAQMKHGDEDVGDHDKENSPFNPSKLLLHEAQYGENYDEGMPDHEPPPPESNEELVMDSDEENNLQNDARDKRSLSIEVGSKPRIKTTANEPDKSKKKELTAKKHQRNKAAPRKGLTERRTNIRDIENDDDDEADGLRRSKRVRYEPLEWWRCEKVVYGRRSSGGRQVVPVIKEIIRIPKEEHLPLSRKRSSRKHRSKKRESKVEHDSEEDGDTEADWDADTPSRGVVLDFSTNDEVERRVVFTSRMLDPQPAGDNSFSYQKIFADNEFIAAGQLVVPTGSSKPGKSTKDNTYMFLLMEGVVRIRIHESDYVLASGGMFMVPRGNIYHIQNIGKRSAKLFFAQARRIPAEELSETRANSEVGSQVAS